MIAIVDTGGANHTSVQDALMRLGAESVVTSSEDAIRSAWRVILPGVGHAGFAMEKLRSARLLQVIPTLTQPVLGICLGMQILFSSSDEGDALGLGIFPGRVTRMKPSEDFRVPHMGWNQLDIVSESRLLAGVDPEAFFYFVHSFECPADASVVARSRAPHPVSAVLERDNFFATQFHPERSGASGATLLRNFLA